jgi:transposase
VVAVTTAGQRHDSLAAGPLLRRLKVARTGPAANPPRSAAGRQGLLQPRPPRRAASAPDQQKSRAAKGSRGGRPPAFDTTAYKRRNTVERSIGKLKEFRAVAMRTDKREFVFRGTIDLASIKIWLRNPANQDLRDRP